ncbi:hypothetical protein F4809DRAFT_659316 [Biscogniauxia mediterranea]|nr:hypothetical protein F4809DRAFT_659316 [Biscogniauxia mediterranea]
MTRDVQVTEDQFQHNLRQFHEIFYLKQDSVQYYTAEVVKICNAALSAALIRHIPITSRVKKWESAKDSIKRHQNTRLLWERVRSHANTTEKDWISYCRRRGLEQHDMIPFANGQEMLRALHDFGGVRISLYFPGDVAKVVNVLKAHLNIIRMTEDGRHPADENYLRDWVTSLDGVGADKGVTIAKPPDDCKPIFGGHKNTNLVVKLQEADIPENVYTDWKDIVVEVQVGTVVMHMWSELHSMVYKPLQQPGGEVSSDEIRALDMINGITLTGEVALQQLEASTEKRLSQRAKDQAAFASSHHELVFWIENYYKAREMPLTQGKWKLPKELYEILKVNGNHKHGRVEELLERVHAPDVPIRQELPEMILEALCAEPGRCQPPPERNLSSTKEQALADARFWGTRLIQSTNVAIYLGVGEQFVDTSGIELAPPPLTHFLDLMHPYSPYPVDIAHAARISAYCQKVISQNLERDRLQRVSARLPQTGCIHSVSPPRPVLVPGLLSRLFALHGGEGGTDSAGMLGLIHDHVSRGAPGDDEIVLWDRLLAPSGGRSSTTTIAQRAFVSQAPPWERKGAWRLEDLAVESEATQWDVLEGARVPVPDLPAPEEDDGGKNDNNKAPGIVGLACRLHPKARWDDVRRAWKAADALQPAVKLGEGGGEGGGGGGGGGGGRDLERNSCCD